MRVAIVAAKTTPTNAALARRGTGYTWVEITPAEAVSVLRPEDVALARLDVLPTLDGVDNGLWALGALDARGVRVLNHPSTLLATHDKLITARLLERAGLPHPRTYLVVSGDEQPELSGSVVVKPRFGSWGRDVVRCKDGDSLGRHLPTLHDRAWFQRHGALVQELVPPLGYDLRIVVAADEVVGAVIRVSPDGEWRTNVALGARRVPTTPPIDASELAIAAARAVGADLVGIDLLPTPSGGWTILELNGAVEFTDEYSLQRDIFAAATSELERRARERRPDELEALPALTAG